MNSTHKRLVKSMFKGKPFVLSFRVGIEELERLETQSSITIEIKGERYRLQKV